jgi:replicative DNA helicase
MITFPDGTKTGIYGMDAVMEDLYHQGKPADAATVEEMMDRLEEHNYFAPSVRHIYKSLLREEYRRFLERKPKQE